MQFERYLSSIASAFNLDVLPSMTDSYPKYRAELGEMLLLRLATDLAGGFGSDFTRHLAAAPIALDGAQMPTSINAAIESLRGLGGADDAAVDAARARLALAIGTDGAALDREDALTLFGTIADAEQRARAAREARIGERLAAASRRQGSAEELAVDADRMAAYLRRHFGRTDCEVVSVKPIPGGRSKGTILLDADIGGERHAFVLRKDFSNNFMDSMVRDEYPVIRVAFDAGITVPEPLWFEADETVLNGQFIVFARVPGRAAGTLFEIEAGPAVIRDYAAQLGGLHAIDVRSTGLRDRLKFGKCDEPVTEMIVKSYAKHKTVTAEELLLEIAHRWLLANLDCVDQRGALVHGDPGFHNVLYEGDALTGLLDWELAHLGDPAEDLMKCKAAASQVIPWEEFMSIYAGHGGATVAPRREKFFTIWRLVDFSLYAADARAMFESGEDNDLRLAAVGYNTFGRLQNALAAVLAND